MQGRALHGRVAVVTGAAGGIGRLLVQALLAEGARVAALDVNAEGLAALRGGLPAEARNRLRVRTTDISDHAACRSAAADAIAVLGGLHILINNGAIGLGAIRADHQKVPIGDPGDRAADVAAIRGDEPLGRLEHDARRDRAPAWPAPRPDHQRHHELRHHAARRVPSLRAMQSRPRGHVGGTRGRIQGHRRHRQRRASRRPGRHAHGAVRVGL